MIYTVPGLGSKSMQDSLLFLIFTAYHINQLAYSTSELKKLCTGGGTQACTFW
jgi:hypothetical protein